jgi:hypothetical protein
MFDDQEPPQKTSRRNTYWERPASRSGVEREKHFQAWKARIHDPYIEAGGKAWYADEGEQRALFIRRYQRPEAPEL